MTRVDAIRILEEIKLNDDNLTQYTKQYTDIR